MTEFLKDFNHRLAEQKSDLLHRIEIEKECGFAKDEEISVIRRSCDKGKIELIRSRESESSLANCNNLLVSECEKKDKELKKLSDQIGKQKSEVKKLMNRNDSLVKKLSGAKNLASATVSSQATQTALAPSYNYSAPNSRKDEPKALAAATTQIPVLLHGQVQAKKQLQKESEMRGQGWQKVQKSKIFKTKRKVFIKGDETVRNLGSIMNYENSRIEAEVTVRGGCTAGKASHVILSDCENIPAESTLVYSFGSHDLRLMSAPRVKEKIDMMISAAERATDKLGNGTQVVVMPVPPQNDDRRDRDATDVNSFMKNRCKNSNVNFIDPFLEDQDMASDGIQVRPTGRRKLAQAIQQFTRNRVSLQRV